MERDLGEVLQRIVSETERAKPGIVVVDSFRTIGGANNGSERGEAFDLDKFVQRLALHLTTWEVTSFLLGEYADGGAAKSRLHCGRRCTLAHAGH